MVVALAATACAGSGDSAVDATASDAPAGGATTCEATEPETDAEVAAAMFAAALP